MAQVDTSGSVAKSVERNPRYTVSPYFRSLLVETRCGQLPVVHNIVSVSRNHPLIEGFQRLFDHQILSVPVMEPGMNIIVGFLDIIDILAFLVQKLRSFGQVAPYDALKTMRQLDFLDMNTCGDAMNASGRNPFVTVSPNDTLERLVALMGQRNAHRVAVVGPNGELLNFITQSALLRFICRMAEVAKPGPNMLGAIVHQPISRYVQPTNVLCSPLNARTIDAFVAMIDVQKSALAVINDKNQLVGNLSASDLKECGYDFDLFSRLFDSVEDFLRKMFIRKGKLARGERDLPKPYCVSTTTTIGQTMNMLNEYKVHRLYMVDDAFRPIGVVTPADVLRCFVGTP